MSGTKPTARIEVFRPGTFTPMSGERLSYSADDLRAIAASYSFENAPAPIVVGHPKTDAPAFGWAQSFDYDEETERLYATVTNIQPAFADAIKDGRYKKVSMSFFKPEADNNPLPGTWYPKHIGFLGGAAPAVSGLKPVSLGGSEEQAETFIVFGEPGFEQAASLFRSMREFFIEKFGSEAADKALPSYQIEWLDASEVEPKPLPSPRFSETKPDNRKDPTVFKPANPDFAAREAGLTEREQRIADRERKLRHDDNVAFAESLAAEGRIVPAKVAELAGLLDAVPEEAEVSFSGGEAKSLSQALRDIFKAQPKIVSFGAVDLGDDPDETETVSFASDGKAVDPEGLKIHTKALAYQRAHPGTSYEAAVDAVL